jgi:hypothetical protein
MTYQSDAERRRMAEALQAQAQFFEELTGLCWDEFRADEFRDSANRCRTAATKVLAD